MPPHSPLGYLRHMRDACERLIECASLRDTGTTPGYILLDAVCRNLEILGEASRKVGAQFRADHPEIPWRQMNDLRNVLIHNYDVAEAELIWGVVEREIPRVLTELSNLLRQNPE
jgi:uncharacterized protein with HEPN domain